MGPITTIGLDIAKSVFQVHGVDAGEEIVLRRRPTRARLIPFFEKLGRCPVGIEASATSHFWARELRKLGHDVRLIRPRYVKPYVKRQKNDSADAEVICETVTRPTMRFVEVKSPEQQSVMVLHRTRQMLAAADPAVERDPGPHGRVWDRSPRRAQRSPEAHRYRS
jgi:transposase